MYAKRKLAARIGLAALAMVGLGFGSLVAAADEKPNIILNVSDDTGYGDLGAYGGARVVACPRRISTAWPTKA